ncbi:MAG: DUF4388 domain-containing protein [Candidatus Obscuribacterales bacterium]|nr:DUF4388 domain-containing protein [Candidatus Obscuribacterales bacterium]
MFSNQHNIPKQQYRVDTHPAIAELVKFIQQAQKIKGIKHCFYWEVDKNRKRYTLTLHQKGITDEMEWWMHEATSAGERMIWFYRTNDLGVVYPQVLQAVGAPDPLHVEQEAAAIPSTLIESLGGIKYASPGTRHMAPGSVNAANQQAAKPPLAKLLSGELQSLPMTSILQTAARESATGRVLIASPEGDAVVQFLHGRPIHASTSIHDGLEAILELCTWMNGEASYAPGTSDDINTIGHSVEQILYLSAQLIENIGFLQDNAVDDLSTLHRVTNAIPEQAFEKRILDGPPLGLELQKKFFQSLDGKRRLKDIAKLLSLASSQWIAIVCNLLRLGLILTPDGRCLMEQNYEAAPVVPQGQSSTSNYFASAQSAESMHAQLSGVSRPVTPGPSNQPGHSQMIQSESGQFTTQSPSSGAAPSGSWGTQATSTQPSTRAAPSGSWGTQPTTNQPSTGAAPSGSWGAQPTTNQPSTGAAPSGSWGTQSTSTQPSTGAAPSGSWGTQPVNASTQTGSHAAPSGSWGTQQSPVAGHPLVPPSNTFGVSGIAGGERAQSPAVQAFVSATSQEIDSVHVGVQTEMIAFDGAASKNVMHTLSAPDTNVYTSDVMQFFLDREFARSYRFASTFSLVVFSLKLKSDVPASMTPLKIASMVASAITKIKQEVDILGHFGDKGYAIILPGSDAHEAAKLVDKITTGLANHAPELAEIRPTFYVGIASVPHDAKDLNSLVINAQKAMHDAVKRNVTRVLFSDENS